MLFSKALLFAGIALASTNGQMIASKRATSNEAAVMISNINTVTQQSADLKAVAQILNVVNSITVGPRIAQGFQQIMQTLGSYVSQMQTSAELKDADAKAVVVALKQFVVVHQQLLNVIIGKHGLATVVPFVGPPIAAALRQLEGVIDAFAFGLIAIIPTQAPTATIQFNMVQMTLQQAIQVYSQPLKA